MDECKPLDLGKFIDKGVRVKLSGGREGACPPPAPPPRGRTAPQTNCFYIWLLGGDRIGAVGRPPRRGRAGA